MASNNELFFIEARQHINLLVNLPRGRVVEQQSVRQFQFWLAAKDQKIDLVEGDFS